jgi:hypothetical protein
MKMNKYLAIIKDDKEVVFACKVNSNTIDDAKQDKKLLEILRMTKGILLEIRELTWSIETVQ